MGAERLTAAGTRALDALRALREFSADIDQRFSAGGGGDSPAPSVASDRAKLLALLPVALVVPDDLPRSGCAGLGTPAAADGGAAAGSGGAAAGATAAADDGKTARYVLLLNKMYGLVHPTTKRPLVSLYTPVEGLLPPGIFRTLALPLTLGVSATVLADALTLLYLSHSCVDHIITAPDTLPDGTGAKHVLAFVVRASDVYERTVGEANMRSRLRAFATGAAARYGEQWSAALMGTPDALARTIAM